MKRKYKCGDTFESKAGKLEYISDSGLKDGRVIGLWKCCCGLEFIVDNSKITIGNTKSCGCWDKKIKFDRMKNPDEIYIYKLWSSIKRRCGDKNRRSYHRYGGRGISMCDEWKNDSKKFIEDIIKNLGHKPTTKHQLDRIDNDGNYEISNVRWVTPAENSYNILKINDENKSLAEWSIIANISPNVISDRIKANWPENQLLSPIRQRKLKEEDTISIRNKYIIDNKSQPQLAKEYNVSLDTIVNVIHKRNAYADKKQIITTDLKEFSKIISDHIAPFNIKIDIVSTIESLKDNNIMFETFVKLSGIDNNLYSAQSESKQDAFEKLKLEIFSTKFTQPDMIN